ncbi:MAG: exo-alpha-sialidase [Phycisphaeraceae bacterium]|nr:exo-alpha-sialidase [Phycisphaeraceae bacterium]
MKTRRSVRILVTIACCFQWVNSAARAQDATTLALQPPEVQVYPEGHTYDLDRRDFQGIPGIARAANGRLWVTWYANNKGDSPEGWGEGPGNFSLLVTSGDDGKTWSKPAVVIDPADPMIRSFDPVVWIDPTGRLWFFWAQAHTHWDGRAGVWAITTDNPGDANPTWSEPRRLFDGIMMNKPTVLSNGDWLAPVAVWTREPSVTEGKRPVTAPGAIIDLPELEYSNAFCSRDQGNTWQLLGQPDVPDRQYDEHMFVERKDGSIWVLVRTRYGIGQSFSTDGGKTWSPGEPSGIPHPVSRFFIRRLNSGSLLLIRHDPPDEKKRSDLKAFVSTDDGKTWSGGLMIDERLNVSYPDAVQANDGTIYAIYDYDRMGQMKIYMAVFTEQDVAAGRLVSDGSRLRVVVNDAGEPDAP